MRAAVVLVCLAAAVARGAAAAPAPPPSSEAAVAANAVAAAPALPIASLTRAMTAAELARWTAPLADPSAARRRGAALALEEAGTDGAAAIADHLAQLRRERVDASTAVAIRDTRRALRSAGTTAADGAARRPEDPQANDHDLVQALASAPPDAATTSALTAATYARALTRAGTTPAVRALIHLSGDHGGALRPEITRAVHALGDRAVPALLEARALPSPDLRSWAATQLEAMNKRIPADAVQMRDNDLLADVLRAFAATRDMDALTVVLSFVNSDRAQVRLAAREALARYGGDARGPLREAFANLAGTPADDAWSADDIARRLFAAYDRYRLQDVHAILDGGLAHHREGRLAEAIVAFDRALARQPLLDRRTEMVPAYVQHARALEDTDAAAALAAYRKAAYLDPASHRIPQIHGAIAALEAHELEARGIADANAYRRALTLDPTNSRALGALTRLESDADTRSERARHAIAAGIVLAVGIVGVILFGRRPRLHEDAP